ncbi:uncharacterized protein J8A68_003883 [[Candida] subhashii]|uniref:Complex 1 LYR protein domain-containing protein n=1 Tax=[Candida] subhashii TaxID=561895 RepID=A0A8J5QCK7_9ASCO|nr:uncharacterized protein J8A68_003883 [[Candida] subhashii]KAG7662586.1 hypothetical protein J8A68_003883 [[Candida] subhashii]
MNNFIRQLSTTSRLLKGRTKLKHAVSLEEFLFRNRVKCIYRDLLRQVYKNHEKEALLGFIRDEFRANSQQTDLNYRKYLLSLGINKINHMSASMGMHVQYK